MSGIHDRIEDSLILWRSGRREGAFLNALIAVAVTSRKRYPKLKDGEAFEKFLTDCHNVRLSVEYRGECHPIEHILYKWLRCQLVHEAELPTDIQFMNDEGKDGLSIRAGGAPEYLLKIGTHWFDHIIQCVTTSPENLE